MVAIEELMPSLACGFLWQSANGEDPGVDIYEEYDAVDDLADAVLPDDVAVAHAVNDGARRKGDGHVESDGADPRKCRQTARRPLVQVLLAPDWVDDLQIAVDGDDGKVEHGGFECAPELIQLR